MFDQRSRRQKGDGQTSLFGPVTTHAFGVDFADSSQFTAVGTLSWWTTCKGCQVVVDSSAIQRCNENEGGFVGEGIKPTYLSCRSRLAAVECERSCWIDDP